MTIIISGSCHVDLMGEEILTTSSGMILFVASPRGFGVNRVAEEPTKGNQSDKEPAFDIHRSHDSPSSGLAD
jgi:hypothetical protein